MSIGSLVVDFDTFVRSGGANVELLSPPLRSAMTVHTNLHESIARAVQERTNVVLTGTAGSGKTHLIHTIREGAVRNGYLIVEDLAGTPRESWGVLIDDSRPRIIAANEGAILEGARVMGIETLVQILDALHAIQRAQHAAKFDWMVVDVAGYDAATSRVVEDLLQLDLLSEYARERLSLLQVTAWLLLRDDRVRARLGDLVQKAAAYAEGNGFTFRQLWRFIFDLLSASGDETWCDRVFYGDSEVSRALRHAMNPTAIALPSVAGRLWYMDLDAVRPRLSDTAMRVLEVLSGGVDDSGAKQAQWFRSARNVCLLCMHDSPVDDFIRSSRTAWERIFGEREVAPVLRAINEYLSYGLIATGDDLELWAHFDMERRLEKPSIQVSLGTARISDFKVGRNFVVSGDPIDSRNLHGSRLHLVHEATGATLLLSRQLIDGLLRVRSHRSRDREDVEFDWRLMKFLARLAPKAASVDKMGVGEWDFESRVGHYSRWSIARDRIWRLS